ncbi:DUF2750 domain-containing protein [Marinobacter confluentis]|uniref:DUF2750 domain-containing protein n=1 Tax=Marinobacter confluentis TaxID=1697557 RepID=A0A4Z1BLJ3_9GAMM|nr:DUF2750 domain-containing protein [Marinobacter confluentis]TGN37865.1 DUF2750 domain-containing protein [Marinobacter confluentis]
MSISSAQASKFYQEVAENGIVWGIKDNGGFPAPHGTEGKRAMPFWSSKSRAQAVIENVNAYKGFEPVAIPWEVFCERWVPGLSQDGLLAGINWSGTGATGFDIQPSELQKSVEARRKNT